jgi:hypothetical protein
MTDTRPFDPALFHDAAIDPDTANLNAQMIELLTDQPEWWIVGAQEARRRGKLLSAPVFSERARSMTITGKDGNSAPASLSRLSDKRRSTGLDPLNDPYDAPR